MALLCLLLMAAFYLAVIIGQPQEDETASTVTPRTDQPLLSAGQDVVTITSADDLPLLLRMFPAPALTPTTSGWPLVVGTCYDVAFACNRMLSAFSIRMERRPASIAPSDALIR